MVDQQAEPAGRRAVFRIPGTAMIAVAVLLVCVTPAAFAAPGLQALYLVPIVAAVYVARVRTTADSDGLRVRTLLGGRALPWSELKGLSLGERGNVRAVTESGEDVALPTVRVRHLPVLSLVSDGRLADPTGLTDDMVTGAHDPRGGEDPEAADAEAGAEASTEAGTDSEDAATETGNAAEGTVAESGSTAGPDTGTGAAAPAAEKPRD
ncbi:PH domain-containing protein [Amycolatopsis antarctica]|uniref:PH domain-containing protein n=1 Tax=Amycolatopsis antarctica TaxID=1854586 RepID=UPI001F0A081A|nr:PH domain-containing protein [Amycolatopsis antarctica]